MDKKLGLVKPWILLRLLFLGIAQRNLLYFIEKSLLCYVLYRLRSLELNKGNFVDRQVGTVWLFFRLFLFLVLRIL